MHLEDVFDELLDFLSEDCVVVAHFITEERDHDISLMVPQEVILFDEELKELLVKVIHAALKGCVVTFLQFDGRPLEDDVN